MIVAYVRVSTAEQSLNLQLDAVKAAGAERTFTDVASGNRDDRPGLIAAIAFARPGDTLLVWRLDRLGRSLPHLVATLNDLSTRNIGFRSLTESIDSGTAGGRLVLNLFASLASFERDLLRERTMAGLNAARARGRVGGRPQIMTLKMVSKAQTLLAEPNVKVADVCKIMGVGRSTLYRHTKQAKASAATPK